MGISLKVLLLFSDSGGGHRSAAEALIEAWEADYPGRVKAEMVDFIRDYVPFPLNRAGSAYPSMVRNFGSLYAGVFHASDTPERVHAILRTLYPSTRRAIQRMLAQHPADVIVSVHPLANHIVNWSMSATGLARPYVTVVTDLLTAHAAWYYARVRRIIVPTPDALARGVEYGVPPERLAVRGLPVARKFCGAAAARPKGAVRAALGLLPVHRTVLLVGGGEGMGPVYEMARAIDAALAGGGMLAQLVVVAGRNTALRDQLQAANWRLPVHVEGFVKNMPEWMAAADVLVTKAGPGSIVEGLISGLPLILMSKVHGQEDGNVDYVVRERVGAWEPVPELAARRLADWLQADNPALADMGTRARAIAHANAASEIAGDILTIAGTAEHVRRQELNT
jgi:1,2-diacylglycerol 3-beta-galactosyltransferase